LICAVYQTRAGQLFNALKTTQQVQALAGQHSLTRESIWAIWGASAIAFQQRDYETATEYLVDLQAALGTANEWVLANFIDVLRQWIQHPGLGNADDLLAPRDQTPEGILGIIHDWLEHWGLPPRFPEQDHEGGSTPSGSETSVLSATIHSFFSFQYWRDRWQILMLAIRGEVRLQWVTRETRGRDRSVPWWRFIRNSPRPDQPFQKLDSPAPEVPQLASPPPLPPVGETAHSNTTIAKKNQGSVGSKSGKKSRSRREATSVSVVVHMLGAFRLSIGDLTVKLPASRGVSLLKYLLLHYKQAVPRDVLMEAFWPDAELETARNSLNVAMHSLRKALRSVVFLPVIVFEEGAYRLERNMEVWLDVEEFERCVKAGQQLESRNQLTAAVTEYEAAISLYQGDFLETNPYEEWTVLDRERLRIAYLDTLDRLSQIYFSQERYAACITVCQLIVARDRCREDAHCLLMRCYSRQGQHHLALRQYQLCVEALRIELDVEPAPETEHLLEEIRHREPV
jgi:DNA-binding SARP family transcriptional activator